MKEEKNPAANGGARTVANAGRAGDAENIKNQRECEADRLPLHLTPYAMHHAGCPFCANPDLLTLVRCVPLGLLWAMVLLLRTATRVKEDADAVFDLPAQLAALLTPRERASIAYAALKSLDPDDLHDLVGLALRHAGWPPPPFDTGDIMNEAAFWADHASPDEHYAYAWVCVHRMLPARKRDFIKRIARSSSG